MVTGVAAIACEKSPVRSAGVGMVPTWLVPLRLRLNW
jgi:hypothetical protein